MNKATYIEELRQRLHGVNPQDVEDAISYCEEYFDEAGEGKEEQVIIDLGTPAQFAAQTRADVTIRSQRARFNGGQPKRKNNQSLKNIGIIVLGIFALPIALPLAAAAVILLFAIMLVIFALCFAMIVAFGSLLFVGIPLMINGFMNFSHTGNAFLAIGSGMVCIGMGALLVIGFYNLIKIMIPAFTQMMTGLYNKAKKGKRHETI